MTDTGFWLQENVFTDTECNALLAILAELPQQRAGARHLMRYPAIAALANDKRLLTMARTALASTQAVPYRATLFAKTGYANWLVVWHQFNLR